MRAGRRSTFGKRTVPPEPSQAPRDVEQGLQVTLDYFRTRPMQERAVQILKLKLDILWAMNDAMGQHYGTNGVVAENIVPADAERKAA